MPALSKLPPSSQSAILEAACEAVLERVHWKLAAALRKACACRTLEDVRDWHREVVNLVSDVPRGPGVPRRGWAGQ